MPLIDVSVPNLINGVSQQADALRFPSQCDEQINFNSSLTDGLHKRPPTAHIGPVGSPHGDTYITDIIRDSERKYVVFITGGLYPSIRVYDLDGNAVPVKNAQGGALTAEDLAYIASRREDMTFRSITVEDTTFVVNPAVTVRQTATVGSTREPEALVMVKTVRSSSQYSIHLYDDPESETPTFIGSHTTKENTTEDQGSIAGSLIKALMNEVVTVTTTYKKMGGKMGGAEIPISVQAGTSGANVGGDASATYDIEEGGGVLYIKKKDGSNFRVDAYCTNPESILVFKDSVQNFSTLPKRGWTGFTIKVSGDPESEGDEYFLKYEASTPGVEGFVPGVWTEALKGGLQNELDATTLPHLLENHGTHFVWKPASWALRACGDEDSNQAPSFVGKTINGIYFHRNRLGILSDENTLLSENGKFFNFWRTTVIQLLDSDPIDCNAPASRVSVLNHAVASSERFFIFSEQTQFSLNGGDLLTPRTASVAEVTAFENSGTVSPIAIGNRLYYPFKRGAYSGLAEYSLRSTSGLFDADDITDHVPRYLKGNVTRLFGSDTEKAMFVLTDGYASGIYVYRYYHHGEERLLSSWSKWEVGGQIQYAFMADTSLYLVVLRGGTLFLESLDLRSGLTDEGSTFVTGMDRRISDADFLSASYDAMLNQTTYQLPYTPDSANATLATRAGGSRVVGQVVPILAFNGDTITILGDWRGVPLWFGEKYTARYVMSEPKLRQKTSDGSSVIVPGRFQVRYGYLAYHTTLYFRTEVGLNGGREPSIAHLSPRTVGALPALGAAVDPVEGVHRFSVFSKSDQVTITIINDTPLPCALTSVDWEGAYNFRAQRV